ncbi:MAG: serine/threonine-protein kinase, partial [Planctomycetota bacterium]|nr:serine/threonine-protein kinase [Planctomycetota bacterium]
AAKDTQIGEYTLLEKLGEGGFAEVWKAQHHILKQTVAIKIPTSEATDLFRTEIKALDKLDHPNIVRVLAASVTHNPPYLVMDYLSGGTLRERMNSDKPLSLNEIRDLIHQLLEALSVAHKQGIVHGDLKPENLLLDQKQSLFVADFGLSRYSQEARHSIQISGSLQNSEAISGTLDYMPREVKDGQKPDARADIYAFGVLLFELMTGRRPDVDEKPSDIRKDAPKDFDALFESCYTRYEKRFEDAGAALKTLEIKELEASFGGSPEAPKGSEKTPAAHSAPKNAASESESDSFPWIWMLIFIGCIALLVMARFFGPVLTATVALIFFATLTVYAWLGE